MMYTVTVENLKGIIFEQEMDDADKAYELYVAKVNSHPYAITSIIKDGELHRMHDWREHV